MNSGVRLVKQGRNDSASSLPIGKDKKTHLQSDREIVITVKSWIAELEQQKRASNHRSGNGLK